MAFEVVPTAAGRLHSDQYTKIIIINTPINLRVFPWCKYRAARPFFRQKILLNFCCTVQFYKIYMYGFYHFSCTVQQKLQQD